MSTSLTTTKEKYLLVLSLKFHISICTWMPHKLSLHLFKNMCIFRHCSGYLGMYGRHKGQNFLLTWSFHARGLLACSWYITVDICMSQTKFLILNGHLIPIFLSLSLVLLLFSHLFSLCLFFFHLIGHKVFMILVTLFLYFAPLHIHSWA